MHRGAERLSALASLSFGHVHRGVGVADEFVGNLAAATGGDADAGLGEDIPPTEFDGDGDRPQQPVRHRPNLFGRGVLDKDRELVTTETSDGVAEAETVRNSI